MFNMVVKRVGKVKVPSTTNRTRFIGLRVRESDAESLRRMAANEGVGLSTYARMILEEYVAKYGRRG
jgi:predicted DNA binding CopG/RHH family protein